MVPRIVAVIVVLHIGFSPLCAQSQVEPAADLTHRVREIMEARNIPAVSAAVIQSGHIRVLAGFGIADLESGTPAGAETVYEIGSVTKPFAAAAVQILAREGALDLAAPVSAYLDSLPSPWRAVSLLQLLQHTSGIPNFTEGDDVALFRSALSPQDVLRRIADAPLEFEPGTAHSYSNTNYYLLGMVIEAVSGSDVWGVLTDRVFAPLDMVATGPAEPWAIVPRRAEGYRLDEGSLRNVDVVVPGTVGAAGGLQSTVVDLARWVMALQSGDLLTEPEREAAWSPGRRAAGTLFGYGLGWSVGEAFGHRAVSHVGATAGFESAVLLLPDDAFAVVLLSNRYRSGMMSLAWTLAGEYVDGVLPGQLDPRPALETEARRRVAEGLRELGRREVDGPFVADAFAEALGGDFAFFLDGLDRAVEDDTALEVLWVDDVTVWGNRRFSTDVHEVVYYRATTGSDVWHLHVHLTADGRIADIDMSR